MEQPVSDKVNKEMSKAFSTLFLTKVEIVSGLTSKQKRLHIASFGQKELEQLLRFY
jgi:uncharacterized protein YggU (UPF0235/DUF167 family)